jgi:hypothetical protein
MIIDSYFRKNDSNQAAMMEMEMKKEAELEVIYILNFRFFG